MADAPGRTPEEREAARLERERQRAGRAGGNAPFDGEVPLEAEDKHEAADEHEATDGRLAADEHAAAQDGHEAADEHAAGDERELASGTRRVPWRERTSAGHSRIGRRRPQPVHRVATGRGRRAVAGRALALLVLVLAGALTWFCVELFQPFHGSGHGRITVRIPPRLGARQVGDLLARDGVVASGFFFYVRAALDGDRGKLLAGTYHLKLGMSYSQVLTVLTTAPPAAKVTEVTIIPGETRRQIDALLRSQGVHGSYLAATRRSPQLPVAAYGAPASTPSLEGFLYPDTYQLRVPISIRVLVADQLTEFRHVFGGFNLSYAHRRGLSAYDVVIMASIVEKEAATAHDRPLVASVIYNRLKDRLPLGMDSTTRYEFNDYTKPLTQSQLGAPSPYNTRLHAGLPPTPIDSPGLAALQAAAHPAQTNDLYFVVKPCANGAMTFTSSYSQFLADSARYQQARAKAGGRSPTKC